MISGSCLCKHGYYRPNCSLKCSSNCLDSECHQEKGICSACNNGSYGDFCDQKCFGDCSSCLSDVECMECKNDLYYGKTCNLPCNTACINKTCDIAGYCKEGCEDGKYGDRCDQDCLKHCISCQNSTMCLECEPGYFGISCQLCLKQLEKCENFSTCSHWISNNRKCLEKWIYAQRTYHFMPFIYEKKKFIEFT